MSVVLHNVIYSLFEQVMELEVLELFDDEEKKKYDEFITKLQDTPLSEYCFIPFSLNDNKSVGDLIIKLVNDYKNEYSNNQLLTIVLMFNGLVDKYIKNNQKWEVNNRGKDYMLASSRTYNDNSSRIINTLPSFFINGLKDNDTIKQAYNNILNFNNLFLSNQGKELPLNDFFTINICHFHNLGELYPIILDILKLMYNNQISWSHTKQIRKAGKQAGFIKTTDMSVGTQRKKAISNKLMNLDLKDANFNSLIPNKK